MSFSASPHLTHHPRGNSAINDAATIKIRCSRPLCSSQTTTHTPSTHPQGEASQGAETRNNNPTPTGRAPAVPGPNSVPTPARSHQHHPFQPNPQRGSAYSSTAGATTGTIHRCSTHEQPSTTHSVMQRALMLLRKEVIQPHLPVRLPCYDLVPIAGPTFDGSPHKG